LPGTNIPEKTQNNYLRIAAGQEIKGLSISEVPSEARNLGEGVSRSQIYYVRRCGGSTFIHGAIPIMSNGTGGLFLPCLSTL
jgi:hypothetical protein